MSDDHPEIGPGVMLRGLAWDVGLPLAAYYGLHALGVADWPALLAATAMAGLRIVWVAVRDRRLNAFATMMLVVFGIGLILSFVSGDARFLLLKDSITTAVVGLTFLVTSLRGTPLTLAAAQGFRPHDRERIAEQYRADPVVRRAYQVSSRVWGIGLLTEAAVRVPLVYLLPISVMVGLSTVMMVAAFVALIVWNGWYIRRLTAREAAAAGRVTGRVARGGRRSSRRRAAGGRRRPLLVLLRELARPHQHARDPRALGAENVGLEVVADHHGLAAADAERGERGGEERPGRLAQHHGLGVGRLLQAEQEGAGVELEPGVGAPVEVAVHRHQRRAVLEVPVGGVEGVVGELGACAAEDDDVHVVGVRIDQADPVEVVGDVAAGQQQAGRTGVVLTQVRGRRGGGAEDVVGADGEAGVGEGLGDPGAGARGGVGDERERQVRAPQRLHRLHRAGQGLPGDREHAVDVDQHRAHAVHPRTVPGRSGREAGDEPVQPPRVRTAPVDPPAGAAADETVLGPQGPGFQAWRDLVLVDLRDLAVARGAARPRPERGCEAVEHVGELVVGPGSTDVRPGPQRAALEQPAVLREQQPPLGVRPGDQCRVAGFGGVGGVDAEDPQAAGERAEVDVEQEPLVPVGDPLWPVDGLDLDDVGGGRPVRGRQRGTADTQRPDLRERNPGGLDDVAERRRAVERHRELHAAAGRGQEEPQRRSHPQHEHAHLPTTGPFVRT